MSKKYKLEDCDILEINDHMILTYDDGENPRQKILVMSNSPKMFDDRAIKIFGEDEWMEFLFCLYDDFADNTIGKLLDDMYDNHNDTYKMVHAKMHGYYHGEDVCECDESCDNCEHCDESGYLTMKVVRTDENGHRWAAFDKESLEKIEDGILYALADDMDIPNPDLKTRAELIDAICAEESDIDSDEYDCVDDCNGDCDNCEYAEMDDQKEGVVVPEFHNTGKHDKNGRSIYKYDRDEIEKLSYSQVCDMINILDVDVEEFDERDDLIDKLCDLTCLVDEEHVDWPQEILSDTKQSDKEQQYESVNGPAHYNGTECIENMRKLYGDEAVRWFCICSAYKYRFRKGNKPGAPAEMDEGKAHWFEDYVAKMMSEQRYY